MGEGDRLRSACGADPRPRRSEALALGTIKLSRSIVNRQGRLSGWRRIASTTSPIQMVVDLSVPVGKAQTAYS
jgi:hypothetical protein